MYEAQQGPIPYDMAPQRCDLCLTGENHDRNTCPSNSLSINILGTQMIVTQAQYARICVLPLDKRAALASLIERRRRTI